MLIETAYFSLSFSLPSLLLCASVFFFVLYILSPLFSSSPPSRPPVACPPLPKPNGALLPCFSPSTGVPLTSLSVSSSASSSNASVLPPPIYCHTRSDVARLAAAARLAASGSTAGSGSTSGSGSGSGWSSSTVSQRCLVLSDVLNEVLKKETMVRVVNASAAETGKTNTEAMLGEVMMTCEKLRWLISEGPNILACERRKVPFLLNFTKKAEVHYLPMGIIGIIVPWNYPFHNAVSHISTALLAGNGALLKPSEFASASAHFISDLFRSALAARGWNPDLVAVCTGDAETGRAVVEEADKVLFIGSTAVGKMVMKQAAERLTPVVLELGGKDPFIILKDADFEQALEYAFLGAFINCGQNCISAERFFVHSSLHDRFVRSVVARLSQFRQGASRPLQSPSSSTTTTAAAAATAPFNNQNVDGESTYDVGSMTMPSSIAALSKVVTNAVAQGAVVEYGYNPSSSTSTSTTGPVSGTNNYFPLTVLSNVVPSMDVCRHECFGPIMTVLKFDDEEELIRAVNKAEYGLGATVFSKDLSRARSLALRIESGMVSINEFASVPLVQSLPFGGIKSSGFGHFNGAEGLRSFCRSQSIVTDRWPGIRTHIPPFLRYPVSDYAVPVIMHALPVVFAQTARNRASALLSCVKSLTISSSKNQSKKLN